MFIITYDISDDKLRTKFSKFLTQYGRKLQYSVYEIKHSPRLLRLIKSTIQQTFAKKFAMTDSVLIVPICEACKKDIYRLGYAVHEEEQVVFL